MMEVIAKEDEAKKSAEKNKTPRDLNNSNPSEDIDYDLLLLKSFIVGFRGIATKVMRDLYNLNASAIELGKVISTILGTY